MIDMEGTTVGVSKPGVTPLPAAGLTHWYAAYTWTHHERRVAQQLDERQVENFVPLYRSVRRWKDRRKELQLALFPSYVFVRMDPRDRLRVLQLPGVVSFVNFHGAPAPLPDSEIRNSSSRKFKPSPNCAPPILEGGTSRARQRWPFRGNGRNSGAKAGGVSSGGLDRFADALRSPRSRRSRYCRHPLKCHYARLFCPRRF